MGKTNGPPTAICDSIMGEIDEEYRRAGLFVAADLYVGCRVTIDGTLHQIVGGQYWGMYGLSNWWNWRCVAEDGTLTGPTLIGYAGNEGEWKII